MPRYDASLNGAPIETPMLNNAVEAKKARRRTLLEALLSIFFRLLPVKHGAHQLLDRLKPTAWNNELPLVDMPYRGHVVRIDLSDLVGWHFFVLRNFDPEVSEVIKRFAGTQDVFWDVGANKGALSYEIASSLPACKIVAIEPQKSMIDLLQKNLGTLAEGRHEVFPVGIGETPGTLELVIPSGNRGRASLVGQGKDDGSLSEFVEVMAAEDLCRQSKYGWPTLAKIDVEGFELSVIRSMVPAFESRHIKCCVFECHASGEANFHEIQRATEKFGYTTYAIRKTAFSTFLVPAPTLVNQATDYAIIRNDLYQGNKLYRGASFQS
jgi:FkbM family methyltransferase